jgi:hypothetical protein
MRPALIASLVLGLFVAGCGTSAKEKADLGQARSVVEQFAAATDASACNLLTDNALVNVYGNFKSPAAGKANCVKKSAKFKGDQVTIFRSELLDPLTAKVIAHSSDKKFSYSVNLRRVTGTKPWRIDSIAQAKLTG